MQYNAGRQFFIEMAAMPFPCNGVLLNQGVNLGFSLCLTLRQVSFPIPYFKLFQNGIGNGLALSLNISVMYILILPPDILMCVFII